MQWEYAVEGFRTQAGLHEVSIWMNMKGAERWELVAAYPAGEWTRYVFKRPVLR